MQKVRILVVEDERIVALDIQRRLKALGYDIAATAVSGEDAIEKAAAHRPDLVLMDIMLQGQLDGIAAAESIRAGLAIPVIYLTAHADAYTLERAKVTEPFGYILKPFEERELHGHIEIALYKHRMESKLKESEQRYMLAAQGANDGLWDWDLQTHRIYLSPRWKSMLGFDDGEVGEHPREWFSRLHPADCSRVKRQVAAHLKSGGLHFESEYRILCKDGSYRWMLTRGMALRNESGKVERMAGSQTDITERKVYDPITGMPNRTLFIDRIQSAVDRHRRNSAHAFAVFSISLQNLKVVVNGLGCANGDQLMMIVCRRLQETIQPEATIARLGEDSFGVLLGDIRCDTEATSIAAVLQEALSQSFQFDKQEFVLHAHIGIALSTSGYNTAEEALRDADTAMHRANGSPGRQIEIFDERMRWHVTAHIQREADLRRVIQRDELRVYYQPIIALSTGKIAGFEALIRWQHGDTLLLPKDFIPLAEQTGLIIPIEKFVLQKALEQIRAWESQLGCPGQLTVNVNLSAVHYSEPNLVDEIKRVLHATGVNPRSLKLEITETALMDNKESVANTLSRLDDLQIQLAMDDFGTGYSSLSYLHQFPIRSLKIDRSFISKLGMRHASRKIVQTIVALGKNLGMEVTAEGVENTRQIIELQAFDCTYAQGYFFARPLACEKATALLQQEFPWPEANKDLENVFRIG
jgi:diguanylate cyclase (GGDEF)-like protein/PAS domain S-box-containing protein